MDRQPDEATLDRALAESEVDDDGTWSEPEGDDDGFWPDSAPVGRGLRGRLAAIAGLLGLALSGAALESAGAQRNARTTTAQSGRRTNDLLRTRRAQRAFTLAQGNNLDLTVTCPRNMVAIGSGYSMAPGAATNVALVSSYPRDTDSSQAWVFGFRNLHRSRVRVTLFVVCTPVRR